LACLHGQVRRGLARLQGFGKAGYGKAWIVSRVLGAAGPVCLQGFGCSVRSGEVRLVCAAWSGSACLHGLARQGLARQGLSPGFWVLLVWSGQVCLQGFGCCRSEVVRYGLKCLRGSIGLRGLLGFGLGWFVMSMWLGSGRRVAQGRKCAIKMGGGPPPLALWLLRCISIR